MSKWKVTIRPERGNLVVDAVALEGFPEVIHQQITLKRIYPASPERPTVTAEYLRKRISDWLNDRKAASSSFEEMLKEAEGIYETETDPEPQSTETEPGKCPKCGSTEWAFEGKGMSHPTEGGWSQFTVFCKRCGYVASDEKTETKATE